MADVFIIGPAMTYFGYKAKNVHPTARALMMLTGVATVLYNGQNYLTVREQQREQQRRRKVQ